MVPLPLPSGTCAARRPALAAATDDGPPRRARTRSASRLLGGDQVRRPVLNRARRDAGSLPLLRHRLDQRLDVSVRERPPPVAPRRILVRLRHVIVDEEAVETAVV